MKTQKYIALNRCSSCIIIKFSYVMTTISSSQFSCLRCKLLQQPSQILTELLLVVARLCRFAWWSFCFLVAWSSWLDAFAMGLAFPLILFHILNLSLSFCFWLWVWGLLYTALVCVALQRENVA